MDSNFCRMGLPERANSLESDSGLNVAMRHRLSVCRMTLDVAMQHRLSVCRMTLDVAMQHRLSVCRMTLETNKVNIAKEQMVEIEEGSMLRGIKREDKASFWWKRRVTGCLGNTAKGSEGTQQEMY